jgi:hypothetical protein
MKQTVWVTGFIMFFVVLVVIFFKIQQIATINQNMDEFLIATPIQSNEEYNSFLGRNGEDVYFSPKHGYQNFIMNSQAYGDVELKMTQNENHFRTQARQKSIEIDMYFKK